MNYRALLARVRAVDPLISSLYPADVTITGVTHDSRECKAGSLFAALPGSKVPGTSFVNQAIQAGSVAILTPRRLEVNLPQIVSANPRRTMGHIAAAFHGHPSRRLKVLGVTGTNGKTTTASLLRHIFSHAGQPTGLLGTVEASTLLRRLPSNMTTPESTEVQGLMAETLAGGGRAMAMEVSSHALAQERLTGTDFAAGIFTNLTQDHLDFHGTMQEYMEAKAKLFAMLGPEAWAIANADDPAGRVMLGRAACRRLSFGFSPSADVRAQELEISVTGMQMRIATPFGPELEIGSPLTGRFNASNILGAVATALAMGIPQTDVIEAVATFTGAPGRLERVFGPAGTVLPTVFVDYAHTPDALDNVCSTLREVCDGRRLVTVFGCGGDRDRTKRPKMGAIARRLSDAVVVTSDNPRTEDPDAIIEEVLVGVRGEMPASHAIDPNVTIEPERAQAIRIGLQSAGPDGVVLIAGKGHEDYQIIGTTKHHFDDREQARDALIELAAQSQPAGASRA